MLLDYYTTPSLTSACVTHALGFLIVSSTKTTSSIVAPPGYCISERNVDTSEIILERINWFTINISKFWTAYTSDVTARMLNSFVTVFVIGSGVICYWRGTWIVVTHIKHPDDKVLSSVIAVSLGLAVCSICYCLSAFIATKKPESVVSRVASSGGNVRLHSWVWCRFLLDWVMVFRRYLSTSRLVFYSPSPPLTVMGNFKKANIEVLL